MMNENKQNMTLSKAEGKKLIPELRFPEFQNDGEWVEKKIEDFFDVGSSKRVLQKDWTNKGVPFYRTRELVSLSKNEPFNSEIFISEELFEQLSKKYGVPTEGDFLVSGVGTLGILYQVKAKDKFYFKDGNVLWIKQRDNNIISDYFNHCFQSQYVQNQIFGQSSASTVGTYTIQNAKKTKFWVAPSLKEQQKIADFLSNLDELIAAHKQKLQLLKQHKKGLMQKLFPQEGKKLPEWRFPEFKNDGEWVVEPLGSISRKINEKTKGRKFKLMSITAGEGLVSQIEKFGREIAGNSYKNYYVILKNDFAYNKSSTKFYPQGEIAMYEGEEIGAVPNSIFTCFRFNVEIIHPAFAKYHFINNLHGKWLLNFITVGARAHGALQVNEKDLFSLPFSYPSKQEQQKIADFFSNLDELITAEAEKIEQLEQHKEGLMQKMFPEIN